MSSPQLFKVAVSAFVVDSEKVLLLKRRDDELFLPGKWEVPGGGVDEGETIEQGLVREAMEEAGIEIKIGSCFGYFEYVDGFGQKTVNLNFLCLLKDDTQMVDTSSGEMDGARWVPSDELDTVPLTSLEMMNACKQALELR